MNVRDLMEQLKQFDPNEEVVLGNVEGGQEITAVSFVDEDRPSMLTFGSKVHIRWVEIS